jgi:hypothetical protein
MPCEPRKLTAVIDIIGLDDRGDPEIAPVSINVRMRFMEAVR